MRLRALVVAGNIAGAATLTVTSDVDAQKHAVRDGTVDFLVTSLDEALRILKNEIRKGATVAVRVGEPLEDVEREMVERGVHRGSGRRDTHR
jgi:urocanate hydratase